MGDRSHKPRGGSREGGPVGARQRGPTGRHSPRIGGADGDAIGDRLLTAEQVVGLQRTAGNRAVAGLLNPATPVVQRRAWGMKPSMGYVDFPDLVVDGAPFQGHQYDGGTADQQDTKVKAIAKIAEVSANTATDIPAQAQCAKGTP